MDPSTSVSEIALAWLTIILFLLMYLPFISWCLLIFWRDHNQLYVKKRRPAVAWIISLLGIILSFNWVLINMGSDETCYFGSEWLCALTISHRAQRMMQYIPLGPLYTLIAIRVWYLFYDLKYSESLLFHKWWTSVSDETDWFQQNRSTFGVLSEKMTSIIIYTNTWYIFLIFLGCYVKMFYMFCIAAVCIFSVGCGAFIAVLFIKMPRQYDVFLIRKEINVVVIISLASALWFNVTHSSTIDQKYMFLQWIHALVFMAQSMAFTALHSIYPRSDTFTSHSVSETDASGRKVHSWKQYVNLTEDDTNWNRFMIQLTREFAVENAIFMLEATQFKQQLIPNYSQLFTTTRATGTNRETKGDISKSKVVINEEATGWLMKLPQSLPKSLIIDHNKDIKDQIKGIFEKYIVSSSDLCINISDTARKQFIVDMKKIEKGQDEPEKALKIFDSVLMEVDNLLEDPFSRYRMRANSNKAQEIIHAMIVQN